MTEEVITKNKSDNNNDGAEEDIVKNPLVGEIEEDYWLVNKRM